jgi:protein ImuA
MCCKQHEVLKSVHCWILARCVETGHSALSARLPGGGWPAGNLTELLLQQPGIGEVRLLGPALASVARQRVIMLEPPHPLQAIALAALGLAPEHVIWLRSSRTADTLL